MVTTIIMCLAAVLVLLGNPSASTAIIALYIFAFGVLICCFELSLKQVSASIAENFGMLYNAKGRVAFFFLFDVLSISFFLSFFLSLFIVIYLMVC